MNGVPRFRVQPGGALHGDVRVPGDKSVSHRALLLGAIAGGRTEIDGFLPGADTLASAAALRAMGVSIEGPREGRVVVDGVGRGGLRAPLHPLDLGNSGTAMRLMAGLLAGQAFDSALVGDASLSRRPMLRVVEPLRRMGACIDTTEAGTAPLHVRGGAKLHGIEYAMPVASAQVKSALLLAGLYAAGTTCVIEPAPTRDHTERMLRAFGVALDRSDGRICVAGGAALKATPIAVPADISSAAFFLVGAGIAPGSQLCLEGVGVNPTRDGVLKILQAMGANIEVCAPRMEGGEPVADLRVSHAPLRGIEIPREWVPLAIDEFPALFIAAACAEGETVLTGAEELRVKESDRIAVMAEGLRVLGVRAEPRPDGLVIQGGRIGGGVVDSHGDHRIAMAFAMAGLVAGAEITILDCANVATSFPDFVELARGAGLGIAADV